MCVVTCNIKHHTLDPSLPPLFGVKQLKLKVNNIVLYLKIPKGRLGIFDVSPCLESQGFHFQFWSHFYLSLLLFCQVLLLFLSYPFLLLALSPDFFSPKAPFSKRYALLCGSCFWWVFFLDEYLSWWYVQHMLPLYGTGIINLYAFIIIYYNL